MEENFDIASPWDLSSSDLLDSIECTDLSNFLNQDIVWDKVSLEVNTPSTNEASPTNTSFWQSQYASPQTATNETSVPVKLPHHVRITVEPAIRSRRVRAVTSPEALEKRRRQNRVAQLASRERNKKLIKELKDDLLQCVDFDQEICDRMRDILKQADMLKKAVEEVLATRLPQPIRERTKSLGE